MPDTTVLVRRRLTTLAAIFALLVGLIPGGGASAATGDPVLINEVLASTTGTDVEFVELYGDPGLSLTGLSFIVVEGEANVTEGTVTYRLDLAGQHLGANGYFLAGTTASIQSIYGQTPNVTFATNSLQNGSETFALVTTASAPAQGALVTGSEVVLDSVAITDGDPTDVFYFGAPAVGPDVTFLPAGAERITDGVDTDAAGDWELGDFSLSSTTNPNTPTAGTPITAEPVIAACDIPFSVAAGIGGSRVIEAADADGTVTSIEIDSVEPDAPGITIGATTEAGGPGEPAMATLSVSAGVPVGSYAVTLVATNNDAEPQSGACTLTVNVEPVLTIGAVQGSVGPTANGATHRSPFAPPGGNNPGAEVFVEGVITQTALFPTSSGGTNHGFFLQSRVGSEDGDANSSDGVFVFHGGFDDLRVMGGGFYLPQVGDEVVLQANVVEFFSLTELTDVFLVAVEASGIDVDDPLEVATTEATPPDVLADANRFWERHEGMRFHVDADAKVVAARDVFPSTHDGELWVIRGDHAIANRADPYQRLIYRDPHPLDDLPPLFDNGNGMRIMLQSHGLKALSGDRTTLIAPARTYDTIVNEDGLTGALYFAFSKYGIEIEQQLELASGADPALNAAPSPAIDGEEFSSSDYNVENLYDFRDDPNDGCDFNGPGNTGCPGVSGPFDYAPSSLAAYQQHLSDLAAQIAGPMHAPDLLMIQEAEDQDICWVDGDALACGVADDADGKPDTLQELALAIAAMGGPTYDAAYDRNGADDRGIVSAFMYRTDTVELLPADADDPVLGDSPIIEYAGAGLAYNADVQNPKALNAELPAGIALGDACDELENGRCVFTRDPQVGHFRVWRDGIGTSVFTELYAVSNHFSSTPDSRVPQRTEQARYNARIADAILDTEPEARIINAGDFNVFPRPDDPFTPPDSRYPSDQLGPMYDAGLHNLWDVLVSDVPQSAYSYSFVGMAQTLDMQWADDNQFEDLVQVRAAHINADFAADYDGDVARGASDHDPQVARWFTDVTFERLHALVDYYVATGDLQADKAFLFHDRLDKAEAYFADGKLKAAQAQLMAFGNQAYDYATPTAAQAMEKEGDRLGSLL